MSGTSLTYFLPLHLFMNPPRHEELLEKRRALHDAETGTPTVHRALRRHAIERLEERRQVCGHVQLVLIARRLAQLRFEFLDPRRGEHHQMSIRRGGGGGRRRCCRGRR
jgi:hypothetical protein